MNYPLISEYVQTVKFSERNFDKLNNLRPVLEEDGNPVMSSGNFAVVFKMEDKETGKLYAVKCFLRDQEGREDSYKLIASELEYVSSTFLTPIKYLEKELFVDTTQGNDTEFPVLLMDWVEGLTLDRYIRNNIHDQYKLALIAYQFCRMGSWLLSQEFAHGDLKPDNIIVREDGQLVLVDYDGMFVPAMRGQKSRELGSVDYCHSLRTEDVFNGSIEDFSIASIALSLKAISLKPELLNEFGSEDRLLFSAKDYQNIGESECLKAIQLLANDTELAQLLGLFYIAYARNELGNISFKLFNIAKPENIPVIIPEIELSTKVTVEDLADAIVDEYGVKYSRDGLRLLKAPEDIEIYKIKDRAKIICDCAFQFCGSLYLLYIPKSIEAMGDCCFYGCESLKSLEIPDSVNFIGDLAFWGCLSLKNIFLSKNIKCISSGLFTYCTSLEFIEIPSNVINIGDYAFDNCTSVKTIVIPPNISLIGFNPFVGCEIESVICETMFYIIKDDVLFDKNMHCIISCLKKKNTYEIPPSVLLIGNFAFSGYSSLCDLIIPSSVTSIGNSAFSDCSSLRELVVPSSVTSIGDSAFSGCSSLRELIIPSSVTSIGEYAFEFCKSLQSIIVPKGQTARFRELLKNTGCDLSIIKEQDE